MVRKLAHERRANALQAARRLIVQGGIEAASVRNVADEAQMSPGSLRHIFPAHQDMFIALMRQAEDERRSAIVAATESAALASLPPRERAVEIVMKMLPLDEQTVTHAVVQLALVGGNPGDLRIKLLRTSMSRGEDEFCRRVVDIATRGGERPEDPERAALDLRLVLDGLSIRVLEHCEFTRERARTAVVRALERILGPEPGREGADATGAAATDAGAAAPAATAAATDGGAADTADRPDLASVVAGPGADTGTGEADGDGDAEDGEGVVGTVAGGRAAVVDGEAGTPAV
ncbi:TetR/AcrR family transcriptional regulator [Corynebacterium bovis]|uniref:AcrR family transcriptional regulator n=3 Tax=Corynebacterium bovis TaxID=36808 RepID=A0A8H9YCK0_9CORY|nr:TetR family transcriptional regulator C-terminal domain-containing protein [Corynebacterium bovis]MBB3116752.1 AcrR family transcriptional regulator [Corynebacterium bovis DSM 20582 = CIP 54.80]QQC46711.1 TetR/AcrR family transcriptional regulator [Corynebacterium bovis]WJY78362.1 transcriptional regulator BetI [Corynebacterium bovis DSM 20582 = CIP 54.80]